MARTYTPPPSELPLPWPARVADAAAIALVIGGIFVALFGGARGRPWGFYVSITSENRFWLAAASLVVLRHIFVRRHPLHRRLAAGITTFRQSDAAAASWTAFVWTRPTVILIGYLAIIAIGYPRDPPFRISNHEFWNLPARWDAGRYLQIANDGYSWNSTGQQTVAFFPAFPMLMRVAGYLIGSTMHSDPGDLPMAPRRTAWAGILLSFGAFYWALIYLFKLARKHIGDDRAGASLVLLAAYPFAVFYSAAYTESLFLLTAVALFYHAYRDEWGRVAVWGVLAGLTRPNGCLLSVPLALIAIERNRRPRRAGASTNRVDPSRSGWLVPLTAAAMPAIGMLMYSLYIYQLSSHPFAWAQVQVAWTRGQRSLTEIHSDRYPFAVPPGPFALSAWLPFDLLNGIPALFMAAVLWPVTRRLGLPYGMFMLLSLLPAFVSGGLLSMGRLSAVLFPAFIYLASTLSERARAACAATFGVLQGMAATLFFTWRDLY